MAMDFVIFSLIFVGLNSLLGLIFWRMPSLHGLGIDFLFFAPWATAIIFGFFQGIVLAIVLLVLHAIFNYRIAQYIFASLPAQALVVVLGSLLGASGFWIALVAYYVLNTAIVFMIAPPTPVFFLFLVVNSVFNILLFSYLFPKLI